MSSATRQADGFDSGFAEELEQLEYYSHGDYVEVKITGVERTGDREASVTFDPPVGDPFTLDMEVPLDPSESTEFTRLLHTCGRNFGNAEAMIGDRIKASYEDDGWNLEYAEPERTRWERLEANAGDVLRAFGIASVLAWWPIAGLAVAVVFALGEVDEAEDDEEEVGFGPIGGFILYGIVLVLWLLGTAVLTTALGMVGIQFPVEVTVSL
ncbi:hypothetical protein [Natrinema thermotolerans]|uniref:hypothetical protein n=1 Tax=Natrinema thermotolerans TaxID=121872 RepID=UPI000679DCA9|nr:hypothetical protein [Natrinema thermotolerans]QCC57222.1 hypothetical protein DVR14_00685 [Natrinema thermotolerans]